MCSFAPQVRRGEALPVGWDLRRRPPLVPLAQPHMRSPPVAVPAPPIPRGRFLRAAQPACLRGAFPMRRFLRCARPGRGYHGVAPRVPRVFCARHVSGAPHPHAPIPVTKEPHGICTRRPKRRRRSHRPRRPRRALLVRPHARADQPPQLNAPVQRQGHAGRPRHRRPARCRFARRQPRAQRRRHDALLRHQHPAPGHPRRPRRALRPPALHRHRAVGPRVRGRLRQVD